MPKASQLLPGKLAWLIDQFGLSIDEVARRIGVHKSHIYRLKSGREVNPTLDLLEAMSNYFEVRPNFWFDTEENDLEVLYLQESTYQHKILIDDKGLNLAALNLAKTLENDPIAKTIAYQSTKLNGEAEREFVLRIIEEIGRLREAITKN